MKFFRFRSLILICTCLLICCQPPSTPVNLDQIAKNAIPTFQIKEGFQIELIAAEPLLADPVDMEIDERGRLFVVEMPGYPLDVSRTGRVVRLQDTDGDGLPDKRVIFADELVMPTGIMRWKNGYIVTDPPEAIYFEDTDEDGRADKREVMLTGFALSNPQHNMNNPEFGLDNWIYLANEGYFRTSVYKEQFGDEGTEIYFPAKKDGPRLPQNGDDRNVRFKPDTYELEICAARTQFGQTWDAWGHHFQTNNARPLWHEVIAARYLQRNPNLLISRAAQYLPDYEPAEVYPITDNPEYQLLTDVGVITSACGINWYLGGAFPKPFDQVIFVCEPSHNLIQANLISDMGASFRSTRLEKGREFLASTDSWFRPSNTYAGPDGALYILDYHRQIIEHPEWMSKEVNESGQLYNGTEKGRIYRITVKNAVPMNWLDQLGLDQAGAPELVRQLQSKNIWWRRTAQRLLVQNGLPADALPILEETLKNTINPVAAIHALWVLEGGKKLKLRHIEDALKNTSPGVRENAIRLAELHLSQYSELEAQLLALQDDDSEKVRFQLLCTLGYLNSETAQKARAKLLWQDIEDEWFHIAALSATEGQEMTLLKSGREALGRNETSGKAAFFKNVCALIGLNGKKEEVLDIVEEALKANAANAWSRAACLSGLAQGMQTGGKEKFALPVLQKQLIQLAGASDTRLRKAAMEMLGITGLPEDASVQTAANKSEQVLNDAHSDLNRKTDAIQLLSMIDPIAYRSVMQQLIHPRQPTTLQVAAIRGLGKIPDASQTEFALGKWTTLTPMLKDVVIGDCLARADRMHLLLDAVEKGKVDASAIIWPRKMRLMNNNDVGVREHARRILAGKDTDRSEVVQQYMPAARMVGDYSRGQKVFAGNCATCHQMGGENGFPLGPDLASLRNRSKESLLEDILMPNKSIADGFELWTLQTQTGETHSGIIAAETATSLTLRTLGTEDKTFARNQIRSLEASPVSLMTPGLESQISVEEMGDLLGYLKGLQIIQ